MMASLASAREDLPEREGAHEGECARIEENDAVGERIRLQAR